MSHVTHSIQIISPRIVIYLCRENVDNATLLILTPRHQTPICTSVLYITYSIFNARNQELYVLKGINSSKLLWRTQVIHSQLWRTLLILTPRHQTPICTSVLYITYSIFNARNQELYVLKGINSSKLLWRTQVIHSQLWRTRVLCSRLSLSQPF